MRLCLMLIVAALAAIVSACSRLEAPVQVRTVMVTAPVPELARQPCVPVAVPDRDITQREVTTLWSRDRTTIRECDRRRTLAVEALTPAAPTSRPP